MKLSLGIIGIPRVAKQSGNGRAAGSFGRASDASKPAWLVADDVWFAPSTVPAIHFQKVFQKDRKLSTSRLTHLCKTK
jgi:hypothetical protein